MTTQSSPLSIKSIAYLLTRRLYNTPSPNHTQSHFKLSFFLQILSLSLSFSVSVCVNACEQLRLPAMERIILLALFSLLLSHTSSGAEEKLLDSSRLQMFVDELPDMPRIHGYEIINGIPKPKSLKIGMFRKKWVSRL